MTVLKYLLPSGIAANQTISIPQGAQVFAAAFQGEHLCVWALVDPSAPPQSRTFDVVGTGWELEPQERHHVTTIFQGGLVWHVFQRYPVPV